MTEITQADCDVTEYVAGRSARDADYQVVARHREQAEQETVAKIVELVNNLPTILRALRERDQAVEALKITDAWLDQWARHIGDCPGSDGCECGLTSTRYEAETTLASIEGAGHE